MLDLDVSNTAAWFDLTCAVVMCFALVCFLVCVMHLVGLLSVVESGSAAR